MAIAAWTSFGAFSCYAVYESSVYSFAEGAGWAAGWTLLMATAIWLLAPTVLCPALAAALGWPYLRSLGLTSWHWRTAWFGSALVGLVVEPVLIWSAYSDYRSNSGLAGTDFLIPLWLLAGFLLAGATMSATLLHASRRPEPALQVR